MRWIEKVGLLDIVHSRQHKLVYILSEMFLVTFQITLVYHYPVGGEGRSALAMLNSVETLRILVFETASDKLIKKAESVETM